MAISKKKLKAYKKTKKLQNPKNNEIDESPNEDLKPMDDLKNQPNQKQQLITSYKHQKELKKSTPIHNTSNETDWKKIKRLERLINEKDNQIQNANDNLNAAVLKQKNKDEQLLKSKQNELKFHYESLLKIKENEIEKLNTTMSQFNIQSIIDSTVDLKSENEKLLEENNNVHFQLSKTNANLKNKQIENTKLFNELTNVKKTIDSNESKCPTKKLEAQIKGLQQQLMEAHVIIDELTTYNKKGL